ncbi:uncharacterized protein [Lolium perenne]|uniref:uncharacterized protein n=1 Tax=Lolium perenne TaxID=4522 RepID=UPI0021F57D02|nr:uncharacterized protein LOC127297327 [Lolium perenne]
MAPRRRPLPHISPSPASSKPLPTTTFLSPTHFPLNPHTPRVRLKSNGQRWQITAPATSFWATGPLDRQAPALICVPCPANGASCPVTLILGDDIGPLIPGAVQQVMELAPLLQDLVTVDAQQVMELDPLLHQPLFCLKGEEEQRYPHGASAPQGHAAARRQPQQDGANQGKAETDFSLVAPVV